MKKAILLGCFSTFSIISCTSANESPDALSDDVKRKIIALETETEIIEAKREEIQASIEELEKLLEEL
ncbi:MULTISPECIES: hypothetical protein [unclassified Aureispira]|uniref:hypothetical protein n=1 Tax=unclassified Aureispira TaxID=2649989 RepID=UPI000695ED1A|nr:MULTISPECIES: hypothetical protein [unclassified Aureispira]WMX13023.1 hypothetical protein QP953_19475 [Aureispira sp. CCB-E]